MKLCGMALPATHDSGISTADRSTSTYATSAPSPLLSLPREIRGDVDAYLLGDDDLTILRASKQLGHDARQRSWREKSLSTCYGLSQRR